jgi:hypothetical protein
MCYRLVNPSSVQGLHSTLSSTRVIVLDESVVVAPRLQGSWLARLFIFHDAVPSSMAVAKRAQVLHSCQG